MKSKRKTGPIVASLACLALAGGLVWSVQGSRGGKPAAGTPGDITASVSAAPQQLGPSGLPIPRFVTLKADKVNVRKGPSSDHAVAFVYQRKGMPVEITAESDNWRKIRDSEGDEGWILQSMLSGRRTAYVAQWDEERLLDLHVSPDPKSGLAARLSGGVLADVDSCDGTWCALSSGGYEGYAEQNQLWGVYPGETVD